MKVAQIQFHPCEKIFDYNLTDTDAKVGDVVIVEREGVQEAGKVIRINEVKEEIEKTLPCVLRKATSTDLEKIRRFQTKEKEAFLVCRKKIKEHNLPMKLEGVHFTFTGSKITFYFTAEERVDFRELVKTLVKHFKKSVRLQQIGVRDATAKIGDIGICGRPLCCKTFLKEIKTIPLESARLQQMAQRGSERITGICGRLMCCLAFEAELYEELAKNMPKLETEVETAQGKGKVVSLNILKQKVTVDLGEDTKIEFPVSEVRW